MSRPPLVTVAVLSRSARCAFATGGEQAQRQCRTELEPASRGALQGTLVGCQRLIYPGCVPAREPLRCQTRGEKGVAGGDGAPAMERCPRWQAPAHAHARLTLWAVVSRTRNVRCRQLLRRSARHDCCSGTLSQGVSYNFGAVLWRREKCPRKMRARTTRGKTLWWLSTPVQGPACPCGWARQGGPQW